MCMTCYDKNIVLLYNKVAYSLWIAYLARIVVFEAVS